MNRVLEHKTPSDSLRLLTNKLVVNCWSDSIFIWYLSKMWSRSQEDVGWDKMWYLPGVVAGWEWNLGQIMFIESSPFLHICSTVLPEYCYLSMWKSSCQLWAPTRTCQGETFPQNEAGQSVARCWEAREAAPWALWKQGLAWLGWSRRREILPFPKCVLAFCSVSGSNTASRQQKGWHLI